MEYSKIINRSVNIVWQNKFLIILGFLASLGSGSLGSGGGDGSSGSGSGGGETVQFPEIGEEIAALAVGVAVALVCVVMVVGLVIWVVSTIARGGMIASVDSIEDGEKSSFGEAWRAGSQRGWRLLGIGLLPALPGFVLFVIGIMAIGAYGGMAALFGEQLDSLAGTTGLGVTIALAACVVAPIVLVLSILRNFAERACMLEDLGVIDSYRRGTSVLRQNLGEAVMLFLLQIVTFVVLGLMLFVPGLFLVLCCLLWPLLLALQGAVSAVVSAMWTLAWRSWTGEPPMLEKSPVTN